VLIVEDDPMVAQLNKRYVESVNGFHVIAIARNGDEALGYVRNSAIDLIILDIYMPKLDGISFLKELRKQSIKIDVILVTAARETENIDEVLKLGAVDYLIKPFEFERLKRSLNNYLLRHQLLHKKNQIEQEDIDKITSKQENILDYTLQKGLHKNTLERIRNFVRANREQAVTSEAVAEQIGVSRVTARRYLEYLVSIQEVKLEIEYGSTGRPSHLYKYIHL
jgi:two-component system CitB family response regulator/two-component system response regulator DctR